MSKTAHRIVSVDSPGMRRVRRVLDEATEPLDGHTIAERAHVAFNTFAHTYRHLLLRAGMMHVATWRNNRSGPFVPLFASGPQIGAPVPIEKVDHRATTRAWKARTGYYEAEKAKRRLAKPPDYALAALLGLAARYHRKTTTTGATGARKELQA